MHPAPSVIVFTVLSGLGFGLLTFLGLGLPDVSGWISFSFFAFAYALAVGGLLASTFHLGNPRRAMKAFSQWRTSWLSREGVLSVAALITMGLYALGPVFFDTRIAPLGWLGAALSLATVFATSMIYGQLKTVPRWNTPLTPLYFLSLSLAGGALLANQLRLASILLAVCGLVQVIVWTKGDLRFKTRGHNIETATGLGSLGKVRLFEGPHSGTNYLMREMVHVIGRKHAAKLRGISLITMSIIPAALLTFLPGSHVLVLAIFAMHLIGVFASRWLFFAQAEHVVGLYYDKR